MLLARVDRASGTFEHRPGELKAIYMAPIKALVQEKKEEWISRFSPLGITCKDMTGDTDFTESTFKDLNTVDVLLTTPEKFDAMTRKNKDRGGMSFFADCALVMIDEVHLLGDERGGALEAVVSRFKVLRERPDMRQKPLGNVRFVACSATVPNLDDVGDWLGAPKPEGRFAFGEEYRPVKLRTTVIGYDPAKNEFMFDKRLNEKLFDVVASHSDGKPTLVFCNSRAGCVHAARELMQKAASFRGGHPFVRDAVHKRQLKEAASRAVNKQLQQVIPHGVGFHSAGLEFADRDLCEQLFRGRVVTVLCCTSTLAMGVNLPAFLCVIRGTRQYAGGGEYREMPRSEILQMCGRAGRPQFDAEGRAVIMTQRHTQSAYQGLVHGTDPIESNLGCHLSEHINAEIASGVVKDTATAAHWLRHSYFFIRAKKNPRHYGVETGTSAEEAIEALALRVIDELADAGMCDLRDGGALVLPAQGGIIMSDMYVRFNTMRRLMTVNQGAKVPDLLLAMSHAQEFEGIKLRKDEKKTLKEWNVSEEPIVRYKVMEAKGKSGKLAVSKVIRTAAEKIFVMTQEHMCDEFDVDLPASMRMELELVFSNGRRIMRGAARYYSTITEGGFAACVNALRLAKSLELRMWDDTRYPMKQIAGCGKKSVRALAANGVVSLDDVVAADPRALERYVNRAFPHGNHLVSEVLKLPCKMLVTVAVKESWDRGAVAHVAIQRACTPRAGAAATNVPGDECDNENENVAVTALEDEGDDALDAPSPSPPTRSSGAAGAAAGSSRWSAQLVVGTTWGDTLLHNERISQDGGAASVENGIPIERVVPCGVVPRPGEEYQIAARLIFEKCVGRDVAGSVKVVVPRYGRHAPLSATQPSEASPPRALSGGRLTPQQSTPPSSLGKLRQRGLDAWLGGSGTPGGGKENREDGGDAAATLAAARPAAATATAVAWTEPTITAPPPRFSMGRISPRARPANVEDDVDDAGWGGGDGGDSPVGGEGGGWGDDGDDVVDDADVVGGWGNPTSIVDLTTEPPTSSGVVIDEPSASNKKPRVGSGTSAVPVPVPVVAAAATAAAPSVPPATPPAPTKAFRDDACGMEMDLDFDDW